MSATVQNSAKLGKRVSVREQALADIAAELGIDADALATDLAASRRELYSASQRPSEYGYGLSQTEAAPLPTTAPEAATAAARARMADVLKAIGPRSDCWASARGNVVTVYRTRDHASSDTLVKRVESARERKARAEVALEKAEASKMEAALSAAKSRYTRAQTGLYDALTAMEAAQLAAGSLAWEAFTETVTVASADADRLNVAGMARNVREHTASRSDVMPFGMRDALRPDPDFQPSDPVGNRVVRDIVDTERMGEMVQGIVEAFLLIQEMRRQAHAEAQARVDARKREERAANVDPSMARLANKSRRRR